MANSEAPHHTIFFYRKGNGGAYVHGSPQVVKSGQTIRFWNITGCMAVVTFNREDAVDRRRLEIPSNDFADVTIVLGPGVPTYRDYRVTLTCDRPGESPVQYAEGGSDPGVIIEP